MRKILKNNRFTQRRLKKLSKIYLIVYHDNYECREFYFTGKYENDSHGDMIPVVYNLVDIYNVKTIYMRMKITQATTCNVILWTRSKSLASKITEAMNSYKESVWIKNEKDNTIVCGNCSTTTTGIDLPYCPICGSKMIRSMTNK